MITDYLSFTKGESDVTIRINRHFTLTTNVSGLTMTDLYPTEPSWFIAYSFDKTNWRNFTWDINSCLSNSVTINNTNPTVYIKGFYPAKLKIISFDISGGNVYADGNVMSLKYCKTSEKTADEDSYGCAFYDDSYINERIIRQYDFYGLFSGCTNLVTPPKIEAELIFKGGCYGMFSDCTNLISAPRIKVKTLSDSALVNMFYNCPIISEVYLYARYKEENSLTDWLSGTSRNGVIYTNADIRFSFDSNDKPSSWTTKTIPETANVEEFSTDELNNIREKIHFQMTNNYTPKYVGAWQFVSDAAYTGFMGTFGIINVVNNNYGDIINYFEFFLPGIKQLVLTTTNGQDITTTVPEHLNGDTRNYFFYNVPVSLVPGTYYNIKAITECGQCFSMLFVY